MWARSWGYFVYLNETRGSYRLPLLRPSSLSTDIPLMRQLAPSRNALFSLALLLIAVLPMKAHRRVIQLPSFGPR